MSRADPAPARTTSGSAAGSIRTPSPRTARASNRASNNAAATVTIKEDGAYAGTYDYAAQARDNLAFSRLLDRIDRSLIALGRAGRRRELVVKPITQAEQNALLYTRWVRRNQEEVERASGGRGPCVRIGVCWTMLIPHTVQKSTRGSLKWRFLQ